ncbi:MAG TPA: glycosyltransferase [Candidatus Sulfotelmatobacter sp.]|nr:glycosyltransferase [Candidatus Sulfotelmatobacter sp.]
MGVSAIVPARDEEESIAACIESLAGQREISEILIVNDQSTDQTAAIVSGLMQRYPQVQLLETKELPGGWVGKNNAAWQGAREARGEWLLFTDADAVHESESAGKALERAAQESAVMVSFSPEQVMERWYEKSLIPYVYCRLGSRFSYAEVNDPQKSVAAANGQFLMIRREVYEAVGGHNSVAGEVLEDVALAKRVKSAGFRIWFGSGKGIVRVRMYRSFGAMWEGWKKNLYPLMGGSEEGVGREYARAVAPVLATLVVAITTWGVTERWLTALALLVLGFVAISVAYDGELRRNQFSHRLVWYGIPGRLLFARVLWASYRGYKRGKLKWKGREYPVGTPRASKG